MAALRPRLIGSRNFVPSGRVAVFGRYIPTTSPCVRRGSVVGDLVLVFTPAPTARASSTRPCGRSHARSESGGASEGGKLGSSCGYLGMIAFQAARLSCAAVHVNAEQLFAVPREITPAFPVPHFRDGVATRSRFSVVLFVHFAIQTFGRHGSAQSSDRRGSDSCMPGGGRPSP